MRPKLIIFKLAGCLSKIRSFKSSIYTYRKSYAIGEQICLLYDNLTIHNLLLNVTNFEELTNFDSKNSRNRERVQVRVLHAVRGQTVELRYVGYRSRVVVEIVVVGVIHPVSRDL